MLTFHGGPGLPTSSTPTRLASFPPSAPRSVPATVTSPYHALLLKHLAQRIALSEEEQHYVCSRLSVRTVLPRQYLLQQHEVCRHENYVCQGAFRSFHVDERGVEHTLHFAWDDWWITDLASFLSQEPATRHIVALQKSVVLQLSYEQREELLRELPVFEQFWRLLHERACLAQDQRLLHSIALSGAERYAALLRTYPTIEQRIPQKYIASFLGITPVFLSQIRRNRAQ